MMHLIHRLKAQFRCAELTGLSGHEGGGEERGEETTSKDSCFPESRAKM